MQYQIVLVGEKYRLTIDCGLCVINLSFEKLDDANEYWQRYARLNDLEVICG